MTVRIEKEVRVFRTTKNEVSLYDREGVAYHWITKHTEHKLFYALDHEWFKVRMSLWKGLWGRNNVRNVRIQKELGRDDS